MPTSLNNTLKSQSGFKEESKLKISQVMPKKDDKKMNELRSFMRNKFAKISKASNSRKSIKEKHTEIHNSISSIETDRILN